MIRNGAWWKRRLQVIATIAAAAVVSCGGGEKMGAIQGTGFGPTPTTSIGPISGFGSIIVNGVEYSTSGAQIRIDGQPADESQLRVGHVVTVRGTLNEDGRTGTATEVSFVGDARGPVSKLDTEAGTFEVLGQAVRVTEETLFDERLEPAGVEALQDGTVVQVSGFQNAEGELLASRVDVTEPTVTLQVSGTVQALDPIARTFRVNALVVDYSAIAPVGALANGVTVNVQGTAAAAGEPLRATSVEVFSGVGGAPDERGEVEGFITSFTSETDFVVKGQRIIVNTSTDLDPKDFRPGLNVQVEVHGRFNDSGALVADRIVRKRDSSAMVRGLVESVSADSNTLTVLGVAISTSVATAFEDKSTLRLRPFGLRDLRMGDYVDVRGAVNPEGGLVATIVERKRPEDRAWLQGVAENVAAPNLTVLGVPVMTTGQTDFRGFGNAERFFSEAPGRIVRLRGSWDGNIFIADRVQIRDRRGGEGD